MRPFLLLLALAAPGTAVAESCRGIEGTWHGELAGPTQAGPPRSLVVNADSTGKVSATVFLEDSTVAARATGEWTCSGGNAELVFTAQRFAGAESPLGRFESVWTLRPTGPETAVAEVGPDGATLALEKEKPVAWPPAGWNDTVVASTEAERDALALLQCQVSADNDEALFVALANAMDPAANLPKPKPNREFSDLAKSLVDDAFLERAVNQVLREHMPELMSGRSVDVPAPERERRLAECVALRARVLARKGDAGVEASGAAD